MASSTHGGSCVDAIKPDPYERRLCYESEEEGSLGQQSAAEIVLAQRRLPVTWVGPNSISRFPPPPTDAGERGSTISQLSSNVSEQRMTSTANWNDQDQSHDSFAKKGTILGYGSTQNVYQNDISLGLSQQRSKDEQSPRASNVESQGILSQYDGRSRQNNQQFFQPTGKQSLQSFDLPPPPPVWRRESNNSNLTGNFNHVTHVSSQSQSWESRAEGAFSSCDFDGSRNTAYRPCTTQRVFNDPAPVPSSCQLIPPQQQQTRQSDLWRRGSPPKLSWDKNYQVPQSYQSSSCCCCCCSCPNTTAFVSHHSSQPSPPSLSAPSQFLNTNSSYGQTPYQSSIPPPPPLPKTPFCSYGTAGLTSSNKTMPDATTSSPFYSQPYNTQHNQAVQSYPRQIPPPPPSPSSFLPTKSSTNQFYCVVCDRSFLNDQRYKQHIADEHVFCKHPGCKFSSPPYALDAHQLSHIPGKDGTSIVDDPEEISLWLESRTRNFPTRENITRKGAEIHQSRGSLMETATSRSAAPVRRSALEKALRSQFSTALGNSMLLRRIAETSASIPALRSMLRRRRVWKCKAPSSAVAEKKRCKRFGAQFTDQELLKDFPICEHFLKFKSCKWTPCHYSHDVAAYRRWKIQRNARGFDIPMRPPLEYQLLVPAIRTYEAQILQAFRYLVTHNFFRKEMEDEEMVEVIPAPALQKIATVATPLVHDVSGEESADDDVEIDEESDEDGEFG